MATTNKEIEAFMKGIEEVGETDEKLTGVIYGQNGTGKTRTSATAPGTILLDINEEGTASIRGTGAKRRRINTWKDLETAYWFLKSINKKLKTPYETVVLDTVTQMEQLALRYVMNKEAEEFGMDVDTKADIKLPYRNDYGNAASLMKAWIPRFRDLKNDGLNVIFNVQEKRGNSEEMDEDVHEVFPAMMPSTKNILCGAVDFIGHTEIKEVTKTVGDEVKTVPVFVLRVGPSSKYLTKFRVPIGCSLPQFLVNPNFDEIKQLTEGTHKTQVKKPKKTKKTKTEEED